MNSKLKMKLFDNGKAIGIFKGDIEDLDKSFKGFKSKYK